MRNFFTAICISVFVLLTGTSVIATGGNEGNGSGTDSLSTEEAAAVENSGVKVRRLNISPAEINPNYYKVTRWDTSDLNMYHVDMTMFRDTLTYKFAESGKYTYTIPHKGFVTSGFGRRSLFGRKFHKGLDINLDTGDEVVAALPGKIRIARYSSGYGNFVIISHEGGLETLYGHMSELQVVEGQEVGSGDVIGLGGSTGQSTGAHLHFEIRIFGEQIDPAWVLDVHTLRPHTNEVKIDASWFNHLLNHSETAFHIVEEGQTLDQICALYELDREEILIHNELKSEEELKEGMRLRLD
jgi:murein DD-endopeptidase MepM/ murein hydrolase activator NlpD